MPWRYTIDQERAVILSVADGLLTDKELWTGTMAMFSDPAFRPAFRRFGDFSGVSQFQISAGMLDRLMAVDESLETSKRGFLVNAGLANAIATYYQASLTKNKPQIFTDRASALAWLNEGVPPAKFI